MTVDPFVVSQWTAPTESFFVSNFQQRRGGITVNDTEIKDAADLNKKPESNPPPQPHRDSIKRPFSSPALQSLRERKFARNWPTVAIWDCSGRSY